MKIVLISNSSFGLINFRNKLIFELKKNNYEVLGFAPDLDIHNFICLSKMGVRPITFTLSRTGKNLIKELVSIFSLISKINFLKPDCVFCFQIKPAIYGSLAAIFNRIENIYIMIEGLGYSFTDNKFQSRLIRNIIIALFKVVFNKAKKVFFLNPDDESEFIKRRIIERNKSIVLNGIGVDLDEWSYSESDLSEISFVFIGRLLKEKGIIDYLKAAEIIKSRYPEVKFYVLGDVDSNPGSISIKQILYYVNNKIVEWPGFVDVRLWLRKMSVFVLPSFREGVPRSTQEALSMGKPVITTDVPGCKETVLDGVNGFLVSPRKPFALAEAMEKFIKRKELIKSMGLESRRLAERKFNINEKNEIIIRELMKSL